MDEIRQLLKSIRAVSKTNPVTYMQLSEIIRKLWRPRAKVYSVAQTAHGFVVGDVIKPSALAWVKAKADTEANAKGVAVVSEIVDADNFIYLQEGLISGDYEIGKTYFLSVDTAGAMFVQSDPEAWTPGQYRQMIGTGTADGLLVEIDEGRRIVESAAADNTFDVAIDFIDAIPFVYNCPAAMKFTEQISEGADATLSVPLNTNLAQFQKLTITPAEVGLIILKGVLL